MRGYVRSSKNGIINNNCGGILSAAAVDDTVRKFVMYTTCDWQNVQLDIEYESIYYHSGDKWRWNVKELK